MKNKAGLWIDHRKAVIVLVADWTEEIKQIKSNIDKRVRYTGGTRSEGARTEPENQRDRRFAHRLNKYYDEVIACIHHADSILIFGPGEAKTEIENRLLNENFDGHIVGIETVDKMTDPQIVAKVRQHFAG